MTEPVPDVVVRMEEEAPVEHPSLERFRSLQNDPKAFTELAIEAFGTNIRRVARHYINETGPRDRSLDIDDVLQDTFIQIMLAAGTLDLDRFKDSTALLRYMQRIAINFCLRQYDRAKRIPMERFETLPEAAGSGLGKDVSEAQSARIEVEEALAQMREKDALAIRLVDLDGLRYRQAGAVMGIGEEAMRKRYTRAKEIFRRLIAPPDDQEST